MVLGTIRSGWEKDINIILPSHLRSLKKQSVIKRTDWDLAKNIFEISL